MKNIVCEMKYTPDDGITADQKLKKKMNSKFDNKAIKVILHETCKEK